MPKKENKECILSEILQKIISDLMKKVKVTYKIRDMIDRVPEISNKNMKDLSLFLNKIESLNTTVLAIKEVHKALSCRKIDKILDDTLLLDFASFQESLKKIF